MTQQTTELCASLLTLFFAYSVCVTFAGVFVAWVAKLMGDDTPQSLGFLALNPVRHFDPMGIFCLFWLGLGWGRQIPLNPNNVLHKQRTLRIISLYSAEFVAHVIMAIVAILVLISFFGLQFSTLFFLRALPLHDYILSYPQYSSAVISGAFLISSMVFLNVFLAPFSLIINSFRYLLFIGFEKNYGYIKYAGLLSFFGPLVVMLIFVNPLRISLINGTVYIATLMAGLLGIS
jgi:hypothetical protein